MKKHTTMRKTTILFFALGFCLSTASAQGDYQFATSPTPEKHQWELGIHAGHFFSSGEIDFNPSFAGGISVRRALDYAFSARLDLTYGTMSGEADENVRSHETNWLSGSILGIATLNNLHWSLKERKTNLYGLFGAGLNSYSVDYTEGQTETEVDSELVPHFTGGAGISFKVNERINIGLEHKAFILFGNRADLIDGFSNEASRGNFRDIPNYTSFRINVNLGNPDTHAEPLYWLNPMDAVWNDIQFLKDTRISLKDTDDDGVLDMFDEELESPEGAIVNVKGVTIDSDGDSVPDFKDDEPFSTPDAKVDEKGVGEKRDIMQEVTVMIDEKLKNFQPKDDGNKLTNWYLPVLYFASGSARISKDDEGTLAAIAKVVKDNPKVNLVVTGYTDASASEEFNNKLSYQRAANAIQSLVDNHGVNRDRLILQYKGESNQIVTGPYKVNRRVTFNVAQGESPMMAPIGVKPISGNRAN